MFGKIMGLATLGSGLANIRLLQRFLSGIATVVALTVISAILVGMLLTAAFIGLFFLLTHFGLDPVAAGILVIAGAVLLVGLFVALTVARINELRDLPNRSLNFDLPSLAKITDIFESFIGGFTSPAAPKSRTQPRVYPKEKARF